MKSRWYLKFPASIRFFVSFFLQGFVTFSGGYHSRSKFFPPKNNSGPVFPWVSSIIAYHEKLRGPPPPNAIHPPNLRETNGFFRPNISTSWEAQSHIYASASMLRSAVSFCCASLMSQQNLDQKKQMVCGQWGASLKRFRFRLML